MLPTAPRSTGPCTVRSIKLPTAQIFGWSLVVNVPAINVVITFPAVRLPVISMSLCVPIPLILPLNVILPFPPDTVVSTFKNPKLPTVWMLDCVWVVNVPVKKFALIRFAPVILPTVILPDTARLLSVPKDVIFGCAFTVTLPA